MDKGNRIKINPIDDSAELFKREYLGKWIEPSIEYQEAYKLWLWYNYKCELFDSIVCTGKNKYEDYMPASSEEQNAININARNNMKYIENERRKLKQQGINITNEDWQSAKQHFSRYKLKGLEKEYKYYFKS